jgi:hypothetical protein
MKRPEEFVPDDGEPIDLIWNAEAGFYYLDVEGLDSRPWWTVEEAELLDVTGDRDLWFVGGPLAEFGSSGS